MDAQSKRLNYSMRFSLFVTNKIAQRKIQINIVPSTFHSHIGDKICTKSMFQHIKNIIPAGKDENFCFFVNKINPEYSPCDCFNLIKN